MTRITLLIFCLLSTCLVNAQTITGKILDKKTNDPLPFASISLQSAHKGTISNEDGVYRILIESDKPDTLLVSYVGYQKFKIPVSELQKSGDLYLTPSVNELAEVVVNAKDDFAYKLFGKVISKYRKDRSRKEAKTFFSLQSKADGAPLEMIEGFYNSSYTNSFGFQSIGLKNGRIGVTDFYNQYYVSLNTTDLVEDYAVFQVRNTWEQKLPLSPGNVKSGKLKRYYYVEVDKFYKEDGEDHYVLVFNPLKKGKFFKGKAWVNATTMSIEKMELISESRNDFIAPINKEDKIDSLRFNMDIVFDPESDYSNVKNIQVDYDLLYTHAANENKREVETKALFYMYDYESAFSLPILSSSEMVSDYEKIMTFPFNQRFWKSNYQLVESEEQLYFTEFFKKNGVLINHSETSQLSEHLRSSFIEWDPHFRLSVKQINSSLWMDDEWKANSRFNEDYNRLRPISEMYKIDAKLMLDITKIEGEVQAKVYTFLDEKSSYYFLEDNLITSCYINMYFDLFEIKRRELQVRFRENSYTEDEIKTIFKEEVGKLHAKVREFAYDVYRGKNVDAVERWNKYIMERIDIDNVTIFIDPIKIKEMEKIADTLSPKEIACIENYNLGTGMLIQGKFKKAVEHFNIVIALGDPFADVYYNRGIAHYYLGEFQKACADWRKAQKRKEDEQIELLLADKCMKLNH